MKKHIVNSKAYFQKLNLLRWRGVVAFVSLLILFSATPDNTCINSVRKVFDVMNAPEVKNNVTYLKYTVTAKLNVKDKQDKNIISSSTFELITAKEKSRIYSKEMVVLRDEKQTFTILLQKKVIYWTNTFIKDKSKDTYSNLRMMQDSVFKHAERVECTAVEGQAYNKMIVLVLDKKMSKMMQMKKISYCIDDTKNLLSKVEVDYLPNNEYENVIYAFIEQSSDYKKADMNVPVNSLVFEKGNTLQKQYEGFKIIDTRKK